MTLDYLLFDPSGNVTILVETHVPAKDQPAVASALMKAEPAAEQVGFTSVPGRVPCDVSLRMAGGEFCGNATMCAAVLFAMHGGELPTRKETLDVTVRASGVRAPLRVALKVESDSTFYGSVRMPKPLSIEVAPFTVPGDDRKPTIVRFDGITHVILERPAPEGRGGRARAEALARGWCEALRAEAIGLLFFERHALKLTPLVYVPAVDTLCWESACGSGTTAIGAYMARRTSRPVDLVLKEPGGQLNIRSLEDGTFQMRGPIRFLKRKTITLDI